MNQLVIIGASGHGKVIADIAFNCGYKNIVFLDDNSYIKSCMNLPVVGTVSEACCYAKADFIVAIGNSNVRESIQTKLISEKLRVVSLIHPNAVIGKEVDIGKGTVIMAGVVINSGTLIGEGCIINTGATVDHDNKIADYVHISVGSHLAGTVKIGRDTWVGAGAIISNNVSICENSVIGAGAVVVGDITIPGTYIGVPAKKKT